MMRLGRVTKFVTKPKTSSSVIRNFNWERSSIVLPESNRDLFAKRTTFTQAQPESLLKDKPFLLETFQKFLHKFKKGSLRVPSESLASSTTTVTSSPLKLVEKDLNEIKENIVKHLHRVHPYLEKVGRYYFDLEGKRFRPMVMLVLAMALNSHLSPSISQSTTVAAKQLRLAEIVEMIHTASIIHDDVIDNATTRRGKTSINLEFGNKFSILSGDFLLAKASVALANLENFEVTRLISLIIADLVEGEFMQMKPSPSSATSEFDYYIQKTFLKTASLIASSCRATAVLGGASADLLDISSEYGKNLGLAFQIKDDLLDFTGTSETLGKEAAIDLKLGLATAPVLFAKEEFPELEPLIRRNFQREGDVEQARQLVSKSKGLEKTQELAESYGIKAVSSLERLKPSPSKDALIELVNMVLHRNK